MGQVQKKYPATTGLHWHRDQYYSFFIPVEWHRLQWTDDRNGVIYAPDPDDLLTVFAVDLKDLGTAVTADDLEILADGYFESIQQLSDCVLELREQTITGKLLELEARYTFVEQGETRKRWVRILYHDTRQVAMTAQGSTPEKYDYWLPWFFEAMKTASVHYEKPTFPG